MLQLRLLSPGALAFACVFAVACSGGSGTRGVGGATNGGALGGDYATGGEATGGTIGTGGAATAGTSGGIPDAGEAGGSAMGGSPVGGSQGPDAGVAEAGEVSPDLGFTTETGDVSGKEASSPPELERKRDAAVDGPEPKIISFNTDVMAHRNGTPQLCWQVQGATSLTLEPDVGDVMGKTCYYVMASETKTYTLTLNGTITATATVWALDDLFKPVGDLLAVLEGHTASLLPDGRVLIAGGYSKNVVFVGTAELYDPATRKFVSAGTAGKMISHRASHSATTLLDGRILLAGGLTETVLTATAEIYDPSTGTFAAVGNMSDGRCDHGAALLPDGRVLVAGGSTPAAKGSDGKANPGAEIAEIFDPGTGTFTVTGSLSIKRWRPTVTTLSDGKVLVAGGSLETPPVASAEVYDPSSGKFRVVGAMVFAQKSHTATLLPNGMVLLTGGNGGSTRCQLYDPKTETFTETGRLARARELHNATLLPNGKVLITGDTQYTDGTAELYDPDAGKFAAISFMVSSGYYRTATLLLDGSVLVAGGEVRDANTFVITAKAELYTPL